MKKWGGVGGREEERGKKKEEEEREIEREEEERARASRHTEQQEIGGMKKKTIDGVGLKWKKNPIASPIKEKFFCFVLFLWSWTVSHTCFC